MIAFAAGVGLYFALGMPGMDHGAGGAMDGSAAMEGHDMGTSPMARGLVGPDEFARVVGDPGTFVLNVHVPADGTIPGTDASMPFDAIDPATLPVDRDATIAIYCRSGNMSATAATTLEKLGYTRVIELAGGLDAWVQAGGELEPAGAAR